MLQEHLEDRSVPLEERAALLNHLSLMVAGVFEAALRCACGGYLSMDVDDVTIRPVLPAGKARQQWTLVVMDGYRGGERG